MLIDNEAEETKKAAGRDRSKQLSSGLPARLSNRCLTIVMILMTTCQTRTPMHPQWYPCWQLQPLGTRTQPHLKLRTTNRNGPGSLHDRRSMLKLLQENQLLWDIKFTDFRRTDKRCCGGLSRQTSLRHTCSHGLDGVGSAQASSQQV